MMAAMDMNTVARIFQTFMGRVVALEDMAKLSGQNLAVFQRELEMFRRSPLSNSTVLAQILASNPSDRLKTYQEAGYRHSHTDHAVVVKLDNALKDLQTHVQQARAVVEEIQRLLEEANGMMHADLNTRLGNITLTEGAGGSQIAQTTDAGQAVDFTQRADIGHRAGGHEQSSSQVTSPKTKVRQLFTPDYVTTMAAISGMLHQDFTMQERVVGTLGLDLAPELLQNYHMMWTLRPFVDEAVVEEALSWTRPFPG
ncbi:hypothetical protein KC19_12G155400 [Ceratodon purpureus]|uniref:DUF7795 domain-containing protein n=1 Tax=Ceratodon purpureus TaxID=3225 RepID=A0A8T0G7F0_CERPU|nr:hypothetical protein KC19_12G155400 [Ceratodon purpureus]